MRPCPRWARPVVPAFRIPWSWAGIALLTGALGLAYPLLLTSRLVLQGEVAVRSENEKLSSCLNENPAVERFSVRRTASARTGGGNVANEFRPFPAEPDGGVLLLSGDHCRSCDRRSRGPHPFSDANRPCCRNAAWRHRRGCRPLLLVLASCRAAFPMRCVYTARGESRRRFRRSSRSPTSQGTGSVAPYVSSHQRLAQRLRPTRLRMPDLPADLL